MSFVIIGFRILGRLPVIFHAGGISKRNRQIVMEVINDQANEMVVYGPKCMDKIEGAIPLSHGCVV